MKRISLHAWLREWNRGWLQTYGDGFDRLGPDDGRCAILAGAVAARVGLGGGSVGAAEALLLGLAELAACFDHEDTLDAGGHGWEALDSLWNECVSDVHIVIYKSSTYTKHVVHEGAAAGPNLNQLDALAGPALADPLGDEPDAEELAKDLGDLGGGDEVALCAELVAVLADGAGVVAAEVAGEAHAHVAGEGDGAGGLGDVVSSVFL